MEKSNAKAKCLENVASDKEAIVARLRELVPHGCWLELGYADDKPFVSDDVQSFRPLTREQLGSVIEWLQLFLQFCPDDREVAHQRMRFCGESECIECYRRERSSVMSRYFDSRYELTTPPRAGFIVMYEVNGRQKLFASSRPERRLREIERQLSESVRYIHRIETNDQMLLKFLWNCEMIDYIVARSDFFDLPLDVIETFKSRRQQTVERNRAWKDNMAGINLENPANLPILLTRHADWNVQLNEWINEATNNKEGIASEK